MYVVFIYISDHLKCDVKNLHEGCVYSAVTAAQPSHRGKHVKDFEHSVNQAYEKELSASQDWYYN